MVEATPDAVQIKSVGTMFEILNEIQERGAAGTSELAESLGLAKSTIHNHLATLLAYEYVRREGNEYHVGIRFLDHGGHARANLTGHEIIKEKVSEVADETGELVQYLVEEHGRGVVVLREPGDQAVRTKTRVGRRVYLNHLSAGKAILAQMPPERVDAIIDQHGLPPKTEQTITDPDVLREHLGDIQRQGYVFDKEEHIRGLCSLGAPVTLGADRVIGAMSIAGPPHRVENDATVAEYVQLLNGVANEIELNLTY